MDSKTSDSTDLDLDDGWDTPGSPASDTSSAKSMGRHTPPLQADPNAAGRTDAASLEPAQAQQPTTDDLDDGWDLDLPSAPQTPPPDALRSSAARPKIKSTKKSKTAKAEAAAPVPAALSGRSPKTRSQARVHRKSQERAAKSKQQRQARAQQRKELRAERRRQRREAAEAANRAANPRHSPVASQPERQPPNSSPEHESKVADRAEAMPDAPAPSRRKPRVVVRKRSRSAPPAGTHARQESRAAESRTTGRRVSAADPRTSRGLAVLLVLAVAVGVLIWLARGG